MAWAPSAPTLQMKSPRPSLKTTRWPSGDQDGRKTKARSSSNACWNGWSSIRYSVGLPGVTVTPGTSISSAGSVSSGPVALGARTRRTIWRSGGSSKLAGSAGVHDVTTFNTVGSQGSGVQSEVIWAKTSRSCSGASCGVVSQMPSSSPPGTCTFLRIGVAVPCPFTGRPTSTPGEVGSGSKPSAL